MCIHLRMGEDRIGMFSMAICTSVGDGSYPLFNSILIVNCYCNVLRYALLLSFRSQSDMIKYSTLFFKIHAAPYAWTWRNVREYIRDGKLGISLDIKILGVFSIFDPPATTVLLREAISLHFTIQIRNVLRKSSGSNSVQIFPNTNTRFMLRLNVVWQKLGAFS